MNATLKTVLLAALACLLTTAPASADDTPDPAEASAATGPCEVFEYWLSPPDYRVRPECIGPVLDNRP
jgi:hypothetical protein